MPPIPNASEVFKGCLVKQGQCLAHWGKTEWECAYVSGYLAASKAQGDLVAAAEHVTRAIQCMRRDPDGLGGTAMLEADWPDAIEELRDALSRARGETEVSP